jgi:hypothetical protein
LSRVPKSMPLPSPSPKSICKNNTKAYSCKLGTCLPYSTQGIWCTWWQMRSIHSCEDIFTFVVCFLLGNSPASEFYMPMFRKTLSVPSS